MEEEKSTVGVGVKSAVENAAPGFRGVTLARNLDATLDILNDMGRHITKLNNWRCIHELIGLAAFFRLSNCFWNEISLREC